MRTRLDGLLTAGRIGAREWQAGDDFRTLWTSATAARSGSSLELVAATGREPHAAMLARIGAITRLRRITDQLGWRATELLAWHLVDDLPWVQLGARLGIADETARDRLVLLLRALAKIAPAVASGRGVGARSAAGRSSAAPKPETAPTASQAPGRRWTAQKPMVAGKAGAEPGGRASARSDAPLAIRGMARPVPEPCGGEHTPTGGGDKKNLTQNPERD